MSDPNEYTFNEELFANFLQEGVLSVAEVTKMIVDGLFQFDLISKDVPVVLIGISFGCILSYEVARSLEFDHGILVSNIVSILGIPFEYFREHAHPSPIEESLLSVEERFHRFTEHQADFFGLKNYAFYQQGNKEIFRVRHLCNAFLEIMNLGKNNNILIIFLFNFSRC